jgi:hypothetical protein
MKSELAKAKDKFRALRETVFDKKKEKEIIKKQKEEEEKEEKKEKDQEKKEDKEKDKEKEQDQKKEKKTLLTGNKEKIIATLWKNNVNLAQPLFESYHAFMDDHVKKIIESKSSFHFTKDGQSFQVSILPGSITFQCPYYDYNTYLYPQIARENALTYSTCVCVDMNVVALSKEEEKEGEIFRRVQLCNIPILIRSKYCVLHDMPLETRIRCGESPDDIGGYFVINGIEKYIPIQEVVPKHLPYCSKEDDEYRCTLTDGNICICFNEKKANCDTYGPITVQHLPTGQHIPLFVCMRAFGIISDKDIIQCCLLHQIGDGPGGEMEDVFFLSSIHHASVLFTQSLALEYFSIQSIKQESILPQMQSRLEKAYTIGYMVYCLISFVSSSSSSERKRFETAGDVLCRIFQETYAEHVETLEKKFRACSSVNPNAWVFMKLPLTDIIMQPLNHSSWTTYIQDIRSFKKEEEGCVINGSDYGYIDPICPLDSLAISATLSVGYDPQSIVDWLINNMQSEIVLLKDCVDVSSLFVLNRTRLIINGLFIGFVNNPIYVYDILKLHRRCGVIPVYTSISFFYSKNELHLYTDAGRLVRPLICREKKGMFAFSSSSSSSSEGPQNFWHQLVCGSEAKEININKILPISKECEESKKGLVEYVDKYETCCNVLICSSTKIEIEKQPSWTHQEIDDVCVFGVISNTICFPMMNSFEQNRAAHQCIMKMEPRIAYKQYPIVKSSCSMNMYGCNLVVAVMDTGGKPCILKKSSLDRGLFSGFLLNEKEEKEEKEKKAFFFFIAGRNGDVFLIDSSVTMDDADMPYMASTGCIPDMIISPDCCTAFGAELFVGKICGHEAYVGDTSCAYSVPKNEMSEIIISGTTGKQLNASVYTGVSFFFRLTLSSKGEKEEKEEEEENSILAKGLMSTYQDMYNDKFLLAVCNNTGNIAVYNKDKNLFLSPSIDGPLQFVQDAQGKMILKTESQGRDFSVLQIPIRFKEYIQECYTANIQLRIITEDNVNQLLCNNKSKKYNVAKYMNGVLPMDKEKEKERKEKERKEKEREEKERKEKEQEEKERKEKERKEAKEKEEKEQEEKEEKERKEAKEKEEKEKEEKEKEEKEQEKKEEKERKETKEKEEKVEEKKKKDEPAIKEKEKSGGATDDVFVDDEKEKMNAVFRKLDASTQSKILQMEPPHRVMIMKEIMRRANHLKRGGGGGGGNNMTTSKSNNPLVKYFDALPLSKQMTALHGGYKAMTSELNDLSQSIETPIVHIVQRNPTINSVLNGPASILKIKGEKEKEKEKEKEENEDKKEDGEVKKISIND